MAREPGKLWNTWIETLEGESSEAIIVNLEALGPTPKVERIEDVPKALRERIVAMCKDGRLTRQKIAEILELPVEWIDRFCDVDDPENNRGVEC